MAVASTRIAHPYTDARRTLKMSPIVCWAFAALIITLTNAQNNPSILEDSRVHPTSDGSFGFLYRTQDGIAHAAKGDPGGAVHGRFTYTDPTGLKVNFNYNAGAQAIAQKQQEQQQQRYQPPPPPSRYQQPEYEEQEYQEPQYQEPQYQQPPRHQPRQERPRYREAEFENYPEPTYQRPLRYREPDPRYFPEQRRPRPHVSQNTVYSEFDNYRA